MNKSALIVTVSLISILLSCSEAQAQSQAEMNAESQESFEKLDAFLNKSYKDLLARNDEDPSFAGALKEAQRAWLKYLELHMFSVFPLIEGEDPRDIYGTSYQAEYNTEKSKLYKQRIDLLKAMTVQDDTPELEIVPSREGVAANTNPSIEALPDSPGFPPHIKGLGIGMSFARMVPWFNERLETTNVGYEIFADGQTNVFMMALSDRLKYLQEQDRGKKISAADREFQLRNIPNGFHDIPSFIAADAKGQVYSIVLQPSMVNYLFKSKDIEVSEFIRLFIDAYDLKGLGGIDDSLGSFSCTTENGVKITVQRNKALTMKKVAEPTKVKGAFD